MNGRFLLDTNVIIALFAKDPEVHKHITNVEEIFVSLVTKDTHFNLVENLKVEVW